MWMKMEYEGSMASQPDDNLKKSRTSGGIHQELTLHG
jgi:hypothetical protein